jgi:dTDP-4-amino-4,6-dideoxygalactose transaminase
MAVLAGSLPGTVMVGPAYTCATVHQALAMSSARTRLIDSAPDSFLMPPAGIEPALEPDCALLLSEVYGIPYDPQMPWSPRLRIFDMAMGIPAADRMKRLKFGDVALFSFGWGKPMYAGWGGMACLRDPELAGRIREIRDSWSGPESFALRYRRGCSVLISTAMNHRGLYGLSHGPHIYRIFRKVASMRRERGCLPETSGGGLPPQWTGPMTGLNRKLAMHNLRHTVQHADLRRSQAEVYFRLLVASGIVRGPVSSALPQSHFPIRLPAAVRDRVCDYLRDHGIDTSTLFPLAPGLDRDSYPHAAEASDEVVTLPLGPAVTLDEVRKVSRCVKEGLRALGF